MIRSKSSMYQVPSTMCIYVSVSVSAAVAMAVAVCVSVDVAVVVSAMSVLRFALEMRDSLGSLLQ